MVKNKPKWTPSADNFPADGRNIFRRIMRTCEDMRKKINRDFRNIDHKVSEEDALLLEIIGRLKSMASIILKPADKNLGLTIMNLVDYVEMCLKHLNDRTTYEPTTFDLEKRVEVRSKLENILAKHGLLRIEETGALTPLAVSLLQVSALDAVAAAFYCLPKIHKMKPEDDIPPGRPIASTIGTLTEAPSKYLDKQLRRLMNFIERTICSSTHEFVLAIEKLNDNIRDGRIPPLTDEEWIVLYLDIRSLYPSIPIEWGIEQVRKVCEMAGVFTPQELDFLIELLRFVLENNYVEFDGKFWLQKTGTAMGTPVAVMYSIIVLFSMEAPITQHMLLYSRFIDDVCALVRRREAQAFIDSFQAICPSIQFDNVPSIDEFLREGVMLDCRIEITSEGLLNLKLFQKELNKYQYIAPFSGHSPHIFKNFIHNEVRRYRLLCTKDSDFNEMLDLFTKRLQARGYTPAMIDKGFGLIPTRESIIRDLRKKESKRATDESQTKEKKQLILHVRLPILSRKLKLANYFQLPESITDEDEFKAVFKSNRVMLNKLPLDNLSKHLVRSRLLPRGNDSEEDNNSI
jgi:hypothetical protein